MGNLEELNANSLPVQRQTVLTVPRSFANIFEQRILKSGSPQPEYGNYPVWKCFSRIELNNEQIEFSLGSDQPSLADGKYVILGVYTPREETFLPVYRSIFPTPNIEGLTSCEVCNTKRAHRNLILTDTTNHTIHSVGFTGKCFNKFLSKNPKSSLPLLSELISNIEERYIHLVKEVETSPRTTPEMALAAAIHYTRLFGYVSKKNSEEYLILPTSRHIEEGTLHAIDPDVSGNLLAGTIMLQELRDLSNSSEELPSLLKAGIEVLSGNYITRHSLGVIAIVPTLYAEYLNRQKIDGYGGVMFGQYANQHVGEVGQRITGVPAILERVIQFSGSFGKKLLVFKGRTGEKMTSFTEVNLPPIGVEISLSGKVKEHKEYDGVKETRLTHVTIS